MKKAFINGIVLNGNEDMKPETGLVILTDGELITDVVPAEGVNLDSYEKVDLEGKYIMPGFINLHIHMPSSGKATKENQKPIDYKKLFKVLKIPGVYPALERIQYGMAKDELLSGCTTVRTVGGVKECDSHIRDKVKEGKIVGPRMLVANNAVTVPGGHFAGSLAVECETTEEAVAKVKEIADQGVDLIKLMITGGVMDATVPGEPGALRMPLEMVKACCDEAHRHGLMVAAHVESPEGVRVALQGGVDTIEHGAQPDDEIIALFKQTGSADICTISPAVPYTLFDESVSHCGDLGRLNGSVVFEGIVNCAKACLANGIPVGLGTDTGCPFIRHYDMWRELQYFHLWCGVSNSYALYTATKKNAEIAKIDGDVGTIEKGKYADFIVCAKNPLDDLKVLRKLDMVVKGGEVYKDPKIKKDPAIEAALDEFIDFTPEQYAERKAANA